MTIFLRLCLSALPVLAYLPEKRSVTPSQIVFPISQH